MTLQQAIYDVIRAHEMQCSRAAVESRDTGEARDAEWHRLSMDAKSDRGHDAIMALWR